MHKANNYNTNNDLQRVRPLDCDSQHQCNLGEVEQLFQAESYMHQFLCPLYQASEWKERSKR